LNFEDVQQVEVGVVSSADQGDFNLLEKNALCEMQPQQLGAKKGF